MKKTGFPSFFLCLSLSAVSMAAPDNRDTIINILQSISLKADETVSFVETKTFDILDSPAISRGTLTLNQDHTLTRKIFDEEESLIISENELRKIHKHHETVMVFSDHPEAHQLSMIIRALFSIDIKTMEEYFSFDLKQQEQKWLIKLVPSKKPLSGFLRFIVLKGEGTYLHETEMLKNNNDKIITNFQVHMQ